jgi:hypothetical protein
MHLLSTVTAESAILLHLEIALVHPQLIDPSGTLSRTLIPLVNRVQDFSFLSQDSHFIFGRFLNAMILHHKDTNEPLGPGLILLALSLNPQVLRGMWSDLKNQSALRDALSHFGMALSVSMIISSAPDNFLHPGLLATLKSKTLECSCILSDIISKSEMLAAPAEAINELEEVLG